MKLTGDIRKIGLKRDSKYQDIKLVIDKVEYLTHKKDGHYFQAFDYDVELENPIVLTGDQLARKHPKPNANGDLEFLVYDKIDDEYVLNENLKLEVEVYHDPEEDLLILSATYFSITLPPKEFEALKKEQEKSKAYKNRKGNKRN